MSAAQVTAAAAQSVYVAPGVYVGGGPVYVVPAPGPYSVPAPPPYAAPTVVTPDGYAVAAPYGPNGYCYDSGYGSSPLYNGDPAFGDCRLADYAYAPGYVRNWYPVVEYDSSGAQFFRGDLGWQAGPPGGAPANPCTLSQRQQNRC